MKKSKRRVSRRGVGLLFSCLLCCMLCLVLCSCNVTRAITTQQTYMNGNDTIAIQVTRTIESYDGTIKPKP